VTQPTLNVAQPIVEDNGTMGQAFTEWTIQVSDNLRLVGTGTPEGVVEAPQYSMFIDETVPLIPVMYLKMLPSIGGDITKGWALS